MLGVCVMVSAQNNTSQKKLLASADTPGVIAKKVGDNTILYRYAAKTAPKTVKKESLSSSEDTPIETYQYPIMRSNQGAVLPFEIVFNERLMDKPEKNKIIYQDLETTKERLNAAGIYDANDLNNFGMPLIAKIVGAGVLISANVHIETQTKSSTSMSVTSNAKTYNTKIVFKIYNKNGQAIYSNVHAPFTATTIDSYQTTLDYLRKQTPFYYKN